MKTYRVVLEPVEDGWWKASVPDVQGCLTEAKTITKAKRRIRQALELYVRDAESVELQAELKLPRDFEKALEALRNEKVRVEEARLSLAKREQEVARRAVREMGFSMREAGELLGVSFQKVGKIVPTRRRSREAAKPLRSGRRPARGKSAARAAV